MYICPYCRLCPLETTTYQIKPGDTLGKLAARFDTTIAEILALNPQLEADNPLVGQLLCIPKALPQTRPFVCNEDNQYKIKHGDSFYRLAKLFNVSPDDLLELNPDLNPDSLKIGQLIRIPLAPQPPSCPPGSSAYIIQKGDSFYKIAKRFNVSLSALMKTNPKVNPDALLIGQNICVPKQFNIYDSTKYGVALMYPLRWSKINEERYEGIDGFFQIAAISSDAPLEDICSEEAHHKLKPYGSKPVSTKTEIQAQDACYIFPSPDQPMEMREQAVLIVSYPKPIQISGQTYNHLILWADKSHIKGFSNTLKFHAG